MVLDYHASNQITVNDWFPHPHPKDLMGKFQGMKWFSKLDFFSGYHQHWNHPHSIEETAFNHPNILHQRLVMLFGVANAPREILRLMIDLLGQHIDDDLWIVYIDDILIYCKDNGAHYGHVIAVLDIIRMSGCQLQETKSTSGRTDVPFVRFEIDRENDSIRITYERVDGITYWPDPGNTHDMRSSVGLIGVYCRIIENIAWISAWLEILVTVAHFGKRFGVAATEISYGS